MARMGRFSRRRSESGGSLASFVASLMRQAQAAQDQAIFDAWQNGGEFQGKPVTDSRLLSYITNRRNGFDKSDPLWDQWNNTLIQHEFSIGEQKIGLAFKQGRVGAGAVASWYRSQLNKIPKNSAFYREVAGRAADWADSAVSSARGSGRRAASAAVDKRLGEAQKKGVAYDWYETQLTAILRGMANGITANQGIADAPPAAVQQAIDLLRSQIESSPQSVQTAIRNFGITLTLEDFQQEAMNKYRSMVAVVRINKQAGRAYKEDEARTSKFLRNTVMRINVIDENQKYDELRADAAERLGNANGNPWEIARISAEYASGLVALAGTIGENELPDMVGALLAEAQAIKTGDVTDLRGTVIDLRSAETRTSTSTSDIRDYAVDPNDPSKALGAGSFAAAIDAITAINEGTAYYGQTAYGEAPGVHAVQPGGLGRNQVVTYTRSGEDMIPVVVAGKEVRSAILLDVNGRPVDTTAMTDEQIVDAVSAGTIIRADGPVLGYEFTNPASNSTFWGVNTGTGLVFTETDPFGGDRRSIDGKDVIFTATPSQITTKKGSVIVPDTSAILNPTVVAGGTLTPIDESLSPPDLLKLAGQTQNPDLAEYLREQAKTRATRGPSYSSSTFSTMPKPGYDYQGRYIGATFQSVPSNTARAETLANYPTYTSPPNVQPNIKLPTPPGLPGGKQGPLAPTPPPPAAPKPPKPAAAPKPQGKKRAAAPPKPPKPKKPPSPAPADNAPTPIYEPKAR